MSFTDAVTRVSQINTEISSLQSAFVAPRRRRRPPRARAPRLRDHRSLDDVLLGAVERDGTSAPPLPAAPGCPPRAGTMLTSAQQQFASRLAADTGPGSGRRLGLDARRGVRRRRGLPPERQQQRLAEHRLHGQRHVRVVGPQSGAIRSPPPTPPRAGSRDRTRSPATAPPAPASRPSWPPPGRPRRPRSPRCRAPAGRRAATQACPRCTSRSRADGLKTPPRRPIQPTMPRAPGRRLLMTSFGFNDSGGGTTVPRLAAKELARRGWEVTVFHAAVAPTERRMPYEVREWREDGVELIGVHNRAHGLFDIGQPLREIDDPPISAAFSQVLDRRPARRRALPQPAQPRRVAHGSDVVARDSVLLLDAQLLADLPAGLPAHRTGLDLPGARGRQRLRVMHGQSRSPAHRVRLAEIRARAAAEPDRDPGGLRRSAAHARRRRLPGGARRRGPAGDAARDSDLEQVGAAGRRDQSTGAP